MAIYPTPPRTLEPPAIRLSTVAVDGIPVLDAAAAHARDYCIELVVSSTGGTVATANLDFLALARRDERLRDDLRQSSVVIADGMPVVWLAKLAGGRSIQRLAGVDLVGALFAHEWGRPVRVAVYGSVPDICDNAVRALHALGTDARVICVQHPPFRPLAPVEVAEAQSHLVASRADIVLVALGCPAQERLIAEWSHLLPTALWVGIGGTLDFYAGTRKRAPRAAQAAGMEWLIRMAQEPRRLGRRYLLRDIPALVQLVPACAAQRLRRRNASFTREP